MGKTAKGYNFLIFIPFSIANNNLPEQSRKMLQLKLLKENVQFGKLAEKMSGIFYQIQTFQLRL